ncbi:tetraspanin-32 isoform X2 [Sminthopsis crassicaudata]|uniref:tetraspanin-32 isoform X2 n=1 Tax=Sminthopsis crassicaudata TaxID=9301 RepID=UPI003D6820B7
MGPHRRVRFAKCQLLATCFFVLLLSLSTGVLTALGRFGDRFVVMLATSPENGPYRPVHHVAFSLGIFLTLALTLGVVLSILAVVREAKGLMAGVEDTMLDTYDLAYEQATRNVSDIWWRKLVAIHDTFGCCGKSSPLSWLGQEEKDLCKAVQQRAGCLQEISSFVREHLSLVSLLVIITLAFMVYGMFLTSFLWLTIHYGRNLDRKGQYTLNLDRKGQYTLTAR